MKYNKIIFKKDKDTEEKDSKEIIVKYKDMISSDNENNKGIIENKAEENKKEEIFQNSNILKTNLIENELTVYFDWKKNIENFIQYLFLLFIFFSFIYGGLIFWKYKEIEKITLLSKSLDELNDQIFSSEQKLKDIKENQNKISLVNNIFENHIYWTNFFDFLEKNILSDVYLDSNFEGDIQGEYSLSCKTKDFQTMVAQLEYLENNEKVLSAKTEGAKVEVDKEINESLINFELDLKVNNDLFKNNLNKKDE